MPWKPRHTKMDRALGQKLWSHLAAISQIRSANALPPIDAETHIEYLHAVLNRYERLLQTEEGQKLDLRTGGSTDLPYLRFALEKLRQYHQPSGVEEVGNENARIYIYFVQSRIMNLAEVAGQHLQDSVQQDTKE